MARAALWTSVFLCYAALLHHTNGQKCVPAESGLEVTAKAYRTPIIVKAKVVKPGTVNHTAQVTQVFDTRTGELSKRSEIIFGPVKRGKGCPRMKKNSQYLLFLESPSLGSNYYRIKFDPLAKLSQARKLKKFLCTGCVKPPKISGKSINVTVKENGKYTFKCKASGNPKPMATFLKDDRPLPEKPKGMKIKIKKKGGGGKLILSKVKKEHEGVYVCRVESFVGNASLSVSLTVLKDDCSPCPERYSSLCVHGRCCYVELLNQSSCRCQPGFSGKRCRDPDIVVEPAIGIGKNLIEARYQQQTIAIMAVCIALLFVILICYIVYCKFKKSRSHIRKEIIARNGHVGGNVTGSSNDRRIADANPAGILGDDRGTSNIQMTGYHSTNLNDSLSQAVHPTAFAQRPQTYDDVILTQQAAEAQPLMHSVEQPANYGKQSDGSRPRHDANSRRRRKNGVAIGHTDDHSRSGSDMDAPRAPRRVDEIKSAGNDSMTSSTSSLAHDLRRPALPIDERTANMIALSGVRAPPAYTMDHNHDDEPDSRAYQPDPEQPSTSQDTQIDSHAGVVASSASQQHLPSPSSPSSGSSHRVTTFDSDGGVEEETMGREEGTLQGVTAHSPIASPKFSHQYLPKSDQNLPSPSLASLGTGGNYTRPKLHYQSRNIGGIPPYQEHNPDLPHSPSSRHDNDDFSLGVDLPDNSLQTYNGQMRSPPSSPRHYQTGPELGMEVPYRHAPVTVASARTHHLPLLTKDQPELPPVDSGAKLLAGSTVSLSSSSSLSNRSSFETERKRNSHKIEV